MHLIRNLKIILISAFVGAFGLVAFSSSLWINTPFPPSEQTDNFVAVDGELPANQNLADKNGRFKQFEYQIRYTSIKDKTSLENEILKLTDSFERNYLLALLGKRNGDFQKSYNLLLELTGSSPGYLPYYDELVDLANITGNLNSLREKIYKTKELSKNYY